MLVLAPRAETADPTLDYYYDFSTNREEFARAFTELDMAWQWRDVTRRDAGDVIDQFLGECTAHQPVIFNMCDGDETNNVPGISVIRHLVATGVPFTGANEEFYAGTTSKIDMKRAFDQAGVGTAPWAVVERKRAGTKKLFATLGTPLIVKPAVSAGSMGITVKSVVHDDRALREQLEQLHAGYHGCDLVSGGVFVERFIAGQEFTTFIVGSASAPEQCTIYPPVERVFHATLPDTEKFLSYDRLWEVHEREAPLPDGGWLWDYRAVPAELGARIERLSWEAYVAVRGHGYGRVDLRLDATTGELHVLEVNAQCGLSDDENYTSIGAILRVANRSFGNMVGQIIAGALSERLGPVPAGHS